MKCSINDIAEYLQISRNTVSKALNGKPGVSETTRKKIIETASEMRYRQFISDFGEEKQAKPKGSIVFLTKSSSHSGFWLSVMKGIKDALLDTGYTLVLGIISEQEIYQGEIPSLLYDKNIKGIIIVEICNVEMCKKIVDLGIPVVTVDMPSNANGLLDRMDVVTMENEKNIRQLIRILADKGKKRFAFAGDLYSQNVGDGFQKRYHAFSEAIKEFGLQEDMENSFVHETQEQFMNHAYLVEKIHTMKHLPEVFICGNDWTALQLMHALTFCGYSIPKDVAITGFDNIAESADCLPPLTTIATPKELLGEATAACILSKIKEPSRDSIFVQASTKLILRAST